MSRTEEESEQNAEGGRFLEWRGEHRCENVMGTKQHLRARGEAGSRQRRQRDMEAGAREGAGAGRKGRRLVLDEQRVRCRRRGTQIKCELGRGSRVWSSLGERPGVGG